MKALLMALAKGKGSPLPQGGDEPAPDSEPGDSPDHEQIAKDAAKDGDWDAMIDAIFAHIDMVENKD